MKMNPKISLAYIFCICALLIEKSLSSPTLFKRFDPRIINGETAYKGQFPWQAAIYISQTGGSNFCGGALISDRWIVTAGHCVQHALGFTIALGSNTLVGEDGSRIVLSSKQYVRHEDYKSLTLANDIALILLPEAVSFNENVQPISLASSQLSTGNIVSVSGWGLTRDSDDGASVYLNYVNLVTISKTECSKTYGTLNNGVICTQGISSLVQSTCEGDSGGPLVAYNSGKPVHVGVVSFGHPDGCESGKPAVFTETYYYRNWIKNVTGV